MRTISLKSLLFVFIIPQLISCATLSPVDGEKFRVNKTDSLQDVAPGWMPFAGDTGIAYHAGRVAQPRFEFHALRIDLFNPVIQVTVGGADKGGEALSTTVSSFVRDNDLLAGMNALPFYPVSDREGEPRTNIGIVIADGTVLSPPHPGFDALVFFSSRICAVVAQGDIGAFGNIDNAVGGFHQILLNNELTPRTNGLTSRHPRSAAGLCGDGRFLYLLVIDGRRLRSIGATEAQTALLLRALGANQGINFDGGGSSALAIRFPDGIVRVVNTPIHRFIRGRQRAVAGSLGIGITMTNE